jgi:hypothetical protein
MYIVTVSVSKFSIPSGCFFCGGKIHKHGKRDRHVIEHGEKVWDTVGRFLCLNPDCSHTTFTLLLPNMLPHKHYAAPEIEQVLQEQENSSSPAHECGAEESTLRRWKQKFPVLLSAIAARLELLANISSTNLYPPLQRVYNALASIIRLPPRNCRLAWAFFVSQSHPLRL